MATGLEYLTSLYQSIDSKKMSSIGSFREELTDAVREIVSYPEQEGVKEEYSEMRKLDISSFKDIDIFLLAPFNDTLHYPDILKEERTGLYKGNWCKFGTRVMLPVYDVNKRVMGFNGWNPDEVGSKYLISNTFGFKAKHGTFIGLECFKEWLESDEYLIMYEGAIETYWTRSLGHYSMACFGSSLHQLQVDILDIFQEKLVFITDNDGAGLSFGRNIRSKLPKAKVFAPNKVGDLDDLRKDLMDSGEGVEELVYDIHRLAKYGSTLSKFLKGVV